jgi:hypothetical protein
MDTLHFSRLGCSVPLKSFRLVPTDLTYSTGIASRRTMLGSAILIG